MRVTTLFLLLLISGFASAQWQHANVPSNPDLFNSSFPSDQTGYVCGYGNRFYKTTSAGASWIDLSFAGTAQNLNAVCFVNTRTGFLASTNDTIYKTSDGGVSWYHGSRVGYPVQNIQFIDSLKGYAFGINRMSVTNDGGAIWTTSNVQSNGSFYFLNAATGWTAYYPGGGNSELHKTTDGGASWWTIHNTTDFKILYDVYFINQNTGWVSGYRHYIARTDDGGLTWQVQKELSGAPGLYSIYFINQNTGWTAGDSYSGNSTSCYYTTNGGAVWNTENSVVQNGRLMKVKFSSLNTGWIVGQYGNVFKTVNTGGLTGIAGNTSVPAEYKLYQNYPNPFNPETKISFDIPDDNFVSLKVYDMLGREVSVLFEGRLSRGNHEITFDASSLSGGVYFYKLTTGKFNGVKKMLLIK